MMPQRYLCEHDGWALRFECRADVVHVDCFAPGVRNYGGKPTVELAYPVEIGKTLSAYGQQYKAKAARDAAAVLEHDRGGGGGAAA